ncbi:MAG: lipase family protein [Nevskia sp.]|nr:lipase family protein [Nevskia sp.]
MRRRPFGVRVVCALGVLTAAVCATAGAVPVVGPAGIAFYQPPAPLPTGNHGDLVWYRQATVNLGGGAPKVNAWNVLYHSVDAAGAANVVTGTVLVPAAAWSGSGSRPVVSYAVGTHGLAQSCAPSLQYAQGTDYENANVVAALDRGYAVLVTDYAGYTTGNVPTYLAGAAEGHAVLDMFLAAREIPGAGIAATAKSAVWGYSQGGQAAAWAGQLQPTYLPGLNLMGVAAGGVPANFIETASYLDGSIGEAFLLGGVVGLSTQYPAQIPIDTLANAAGKAAIAQGERECVFQLVLQYMDHSIAEYTVGNQSLAQLETVPSIQQTLLEQDLGGSRIGVPLYQYHGQADEFIPLDQAEALKQAYCGKFESVTFGVYPGEHIVTQFQAAPQVLSWLADRFAGKAAPSSCLTTQPPPKSTAPPGGGDFVVSVNNWPLSGKVHLKTLNQDVVLPAGSTFEADTDLSSERVTGGLSIPKFADSLLIVILPVTVDLSIVPTGAITGTVTLDNAGLLHIHGSAQANITVVSAGEGSLQIPFGCQTSSPVDFPIDFDGPVSSLGDGKLSFTGTTTFPQLANCGAFSGLFSALMSGPGQTFTFTATPPAPVVW